MLGTFNDSTILRLRVKGSDLDPLALRGRLENVLSDVSLQPRLPPSATLFIRKLDDPLPGSIQLDSPHARAPQAWRQAFQTRFDRLVSSAARPAHGYVADSAESVVFYDYAELLACLTADWCNGSALTRWWWQAFIKRGDLSWLIRKFWREQIEYVPAALEHVVRKGVLVEFVSRLSDVEVREIVQRVVSTFGVTRILRIENADFFPVDEARQIEHVAQIRSEMPWSDVVPESDTPSLRPVQQFFVGIVLMVHRAPSRVRTLNFAREVEHWIQEHFVEVQHAETILTEEIPEPELFTPAEPPTPIRVNPIHADPIAFKPPPPPAGSVKSVFRKAEKITIANATFSYEEPNPVVIEQTPVSVIQSETTLPPEPIEVTTTTPESLDPATIETNLGGLFYLINLAIFLEIYNDFTSPVEQLHDDLSIWDFVTIVGKELDPETDDPIWQLLSNLADREDELITPTWLTDLLPHIRARLHLALGIDDDLAEILLHHEAKITVSPTHLDVFFSLSDHPIEIRLSGLDRNPGWVPAAGRFIAFHYD
ncbi:MAG TPA: hypothetical protein VFH96_01035 [Pyrinomonadaceae bacterium]|nr:hypothetical protein [Pyrinomonadaceae bacterium]